MTRLALTPGLVQVDRARPLIFTRTRPYGWLIDCHLQYILPIARDQSITDQGFFDPTICKKENAGVKLMRMVRKIGEHSGKGHRDGWASRVEKQTHADWRIVYIF